MKPLYELADEYDVIQAAIEENGGELTPELEAALDANAEDSSAKLDSIGKMIKNLEGFEEMAKQEMVAQRDKYRSRGNAAHRLKEYAKAAMKRMGIERHIGRVNLSVCGNSQPSIVFGGDPAKLPKEFQRIDVIVELDRDKVREAHLLGQPIPDGVSVVRGDHLRVK